jgi:hypothetical protein
MKMLYYACGNSQGDIDFIEVPADAMRAPNGGYWPVITHEGRDFKLHLHHERQDSE